MTIALPSSPSPESGSPLFRDFGGVLEPFMGGPEQRINRVGARFGVRIAMPIFADESEGQLFVARLLRARHDRLLMKWPLGRFDPGATGAPKISAAVPSGSTISIKGLAPNYAVKEGQFFSVLHGGRYYIYMFAAPGVASAGGNLTVNIFPMLRTSLSVNDSMQVDQPMIEGYVSAGDEISWEMSVEKYVSLSFSIMEAA